MQKLLITYVLLFATVCLGQESLLQSKFELAQEFERGGDLAKALPIYEDLNNKNPHNPVYFEALNEIYLKQYEYQKSLDLIGNELKGRSLDFNLIGKLGNTYIKMGNRDKAFEIWENALKLPAPNGINYRIISDYMIQNRAYNEAIEVLNDGLEKSNTPEIFRRDIAHLYAITMRYEESALEYCNLLLDQPTQISSVAGRVSGYLQREENVEVFSSTVEEFYKEHPETVIAELLIHIYKRSQNYQKAFRYVLELDKKTGSKGALLFNFASEAFANKEYSVSADTYKYIIDEINSLNLLPEAYLGYVKSLEGKLSLDNQQENIRSNSTETDSLSAIEYRTLITEYLKVESLFKRIDISNEIFYRVGYIYLYKLNNPILAADYFNKSKEKLDNSNFSNNSEFGISRIKMMSGNLNEAKVIFEKLLSNPRANELYPEIKYNLAKIYFWQFDFDKSLKMLNQLFDNKVDNTVNDAIELSVILNTATKDSTTLALIAKADFAAFRKYYKEAISLYKEVFENEGLFFLNDFAGIKYSENLLYANDVPLAITVLESVAEKESGIFSEKALFLLGETYQYAVKDVKKAEKVYEKLLDKFPTSVYLDLCRENLLYLKNIESSN